MRDIAFEEGTGLFIGAAVTMNELVFNADVQAHYPLLAEAAESVASYQLRNRATVGGNLCNASPCADTSPAMLLLDASFILHGPKGERAVDATSFFLSPGQTALSPDEFLVGIRMPPSPNKFAACYQKLGRCRAGDLALVGVAVYGFPRDTASGCEFRIGLGSVAPTPIRATEAEILLAKRAPAEDTFALAAEKAMETASPITDVRGTASYQLAAVRTLTQRALREVWTRMQEGM
jgi:carbon-monoxide dehydrogenase medium subunit